MLWSMDVRGDYRGRGHDMMMMSFVNMNMLIDQLFKARREIVHVPKLSFFYGLRYPLVAIEPFHSPVRKNNQINWSCDVIVFKDTNIISALLMIVTGLSVTQLQYVDTFDFFHRDRQIVQRWQHSASRWRPRRGERGQRSLTQSFSSDSKSLLLSPNLFPPLPPHCCCLVVQWRLRLALQMCVVQCFMVS